MSFTNRADTDRQKRLMNATCGGFTIGTLTLFATIITAIRHYGVTCNPIGCTPAVITHETMAWAVASVLIILACVAVGIDLMMSRPSRTNNTQSKD